MYICIYVYIYISIYIYIIYTHTYTPLIGCLIHQMPATHLTLIAFKVAGIEDRKNTWPVQTWAAELIGIRCVVQPRLLLGLQQAAVWSNHSPASCICFQ